MKLNATKIIAAVDKNVRAKYIARGFVGEEHKLRSQQVIAAVEELVKAINATTTTKPIKRKVAR